LDLGGKTNILHAQSEINKGGSNPLELPSIALQAVSDMLGINRTSVYYQPKEPSEQEIRAKHRIDELHTEHPTWGSRQISKQLKAGGIPIGRHKTRRYMAEMGIRVIYPGPNLSKTAKNHKNYPYLLKYFEATRPNEAWSIDITYIRLNRSYVYLTAIIDWYSRCIVGWELDDTLSTGAVIRALRKAFAVATPKILNSDQGSQFTSKEYLNFVESHWDVRISMDGVGRWADNIPIERWFRTLKYDEVYLKQYETIREAHQEIGNYIYEYNFVRLHSAIGYRHPGRAYLPMLLWPPAA
jgi:putative transposase